MRNRTLFLVCAFLLALGPVFAGKSVEIDFKNEKLISYQGDWAS